MSQSTSPARVVLADTITRLGPDAEGAVVVSGSHGGVYPAYLAAKARVCAVIFNDAGVGRAGAGIGSLAYFEPLGIPAATVSHTSCRIADTADMMARGRISHVNQPGRDLGVHSGMPCTQAARCFTKAEPKEVTPPSQREGREVLTLEHAERRIVILDSASLVIAQDEGQIVVTGSHGGLVGGNPAKALLAPAFAAFFNDAGGGCDHAGTTRLPVLDERGIAGVLVAAASAEIGDGRSTYEDGIVSVCNERACTLGARVGIPARALVEAWGRGGEATVEV